MASTIDGFILDKKPVVDWNQVPLGTVTLAQRDPKTHQTRRFTLELTPEARQTLGTEEASIELPISYVFGMRRDGVMLDRSMTELKKNEFFTSLLKK